MYKVVFTKTALYHIEFHNASGNKQIIKKLNAILAELETHPTTGIGKPERLRHEYSGKWSRRINQEHRLVYKINEETKTVDLLSAISHYS